MNTNWIIYLELARDFFTQFRIFRRRTPSEKLDREARNYRNDYAKGKISEEQYVLLAEGIIERRKELSAKEEEEE